MVILSRCPAHLLFLLYDSVMMSFNLVQCSLVVMCGSLLTLPMLLIIALCAILTSPSSDIVIFHTPLPSSHSGEILVLKNIGLCFHDKFEIIKGTLQFLESKTAFSLPYLREIVQMDLELKMQSTHKINRSKFLGVKGALNTRGLGKGLPEP